MMRVLLALLMILFAQAAQAQEMNYKNFRTLPVLHEGRVKPLDSFARHYLEIFSGKETFSGRPAIAWLARTLFDPAAAAQDPVFRIRNTGVLGTETKSRFLSYLELSAALTKKEAIIRELLARDPAEWSADQRALIEYHESANAYADLLRGATIMLPLTASVPPSLIKDLGLEEKTALTYEDVAPHAQTLRAKVRRIVSKKGDDPARYSEEEKFLAAFVYQFEMLEKRGGQSALLKIIPLGSGDWLPPWSAARMSEPGYYKAWLDMALAWHNNDPAAWEEAALAASDLVPAIDDPSLMRKLRAETFYNSAHPLGIAMLLYMLTFLLVVCGSIFNRHIWQTASLISFIFALLMHTAAISLRIYILERPPVGTLYESILFVALITALGGLFLARKNHKGQGLMAASMAGGLLLFVAEGFATDDTMKMLVAVLNTNFWLATHVLCITIGYGWCILSAVIAHFWLIGMAAKRIPPDQANHWRQVTKSLSLVALLFTVIGTILGGIWADQSWGRFWGWDPKENGALLIALWLIWCLHGLLAGQLRTLSFMAAIAALNIIVALAWFGVNLLNTGLHSYGFIQGVAVALFAFCAMEMILIGSTWFILARREKYTHE